MKTIVKNKSTRGAKPASKPMGRFASAKNPQMRHMLVEALRTERVFVKKLIAEVIEEEGLYRAMQEVENSGEVSREKVFQTLRQAQGLPA